MLPISRAVATAFLYHLTQRGNYQECVSEDKDGFISRIEELFGQNPKTLSHGRFRKNK